ncbi:hypothetical protein ABTO15_22355, partial [Acinetobacter baumannii]
TSFNPTATTETYTPSKKLLPYTPICRSTSSNLGNGSGDGLLNGAASGNGENGSAQGSPKDTD